MSDIPVDKELGFYGKGVVGSALMAALGGEYFIDKKKRNISDKDMAKRRYIFICVPTPLRKDGACDTRIVEECVANTAKHSKEPIFVIKSTVIPGTADMLMDKYNVRIVSNPEFLTAATAEEDAASPDVVVIGTRYKNLRQQYHSFLVRYAIPCITGYAPMWAVHLTDNKTAELIKYAINTFYALKVVFANQIFDAVGGVDHDTVRDAMYDRKWIGKNHLTILHKDKRGAGGKCLEKDLTAFVAKYDVPILKLAQEINTKLLENN